MFVLALWSGTPGDFAGAPQHPAAAPPAPAVEDGIAPGALDEPPAPAPPLAADPSVQDQAIASATESPSTLGASQAPGGPTLLTVEEATQVKVTHYGTRFSGRTLGCGDGVYASHDVTIVAVSPDRNKQWRCGYLLEICGEGGCIVGVRQDTCPGCGTNHVDLTEQGLDLVCGPDKGVCSASVRVFATECMIPEGIPATRVPVPADEAGRLRAVVQASAVPERTVDLQDWTSGARSKSCR
jgi:hypothetical protein